MAELWEWVEVYILFQTAVMDESTAKNKNGGDAWMPSLSQTLTVRVQWYWNHFTIDGFGTMEHLEKEPRPIRLLLFVDWSWDVWMCECPLDSRTTAAQLCWCIWNVFYHVPGLCISAVAQGVINQRVVSVYRLTFSAGPALFLSIALSETSGADSTLLRRLFITL